MEALTMRGLKPTLKLAASAFSSFLYLPLLTKRTSAALAMSDKHRQGKEQARETLDIIYEISRLLVNFLLLAKAMDYN